MHTQKFISSKNKSLLKKRRFKAIIILEIIILCDIIILKIHIVNREVVMKKFVDRYDEMNFLNREYGKSESSFVVIYGRRRTGKTSLISEFIKNKNAIYYLATEESEKVNMQSFATLSAEFIGNFLLANANDWETVFKEILKYNPNEKTVIVIDEFQNIGKSNPAFISRFQRIWDTILKEQNVMLILCGSLIKMMHDQVLNENSPLYGRRTGQIKLKQIPFRYYKEFFPNFSTAQLIESYAVTGGVPKYIETFEQHDNILQAIKDNVLSQQSYLYEEPVFLLQNEVKEIGSYFSIIKTIASGKHKPSEIASALGVKDTNLPKYLSVLIDLDIVEREVPVTEKNPEKSKMGIYNIKDNFIEFWFGFVYPYRSYIESGNENVVMGIIEKSLKPNHTAFVYESICRDEYMNDLIAKGTWDFIPTKIGRWWDRKDTEIDIMAIDDNSDNVIFGECKYTNKPMDVDVYYKLLDKAKLVPYQKDKRIEHFVFFSFNGYSDKLKTLAEGNANIILF